MNLRNFGLILLFPLINLVYLNNVCAEDKNKETICIKTIVNNYLKSHKNNLKNYNFFIEKNNSNDSFSGKVEWKSGSIIYIPISGPKDGVQLFAMSIVDTAGDGTGWPALVNEIQSKCKYGSE